MALCRQNVLSHLKNKHKVPLHLRGGYLMIYTSSSPHGLLNFIHDSPCALRWVNAHGWGFPK
jgi:hypothetical protein